MKAYSQDLRERVLRAVDQGYQRNDIIKLFGVSRATIKRYLKQRRETGEVKVRPIPGRPSKKFAPLQAGLVAQLQAHPDATLETHCQLWKEAQGIQVSTSTMGRAIRRVGWTRKKRCWVPLNATKPPERPGESNSSTLMPASSW
jgi:transposase